MGNRCPYDKKRDGHYTTLPNVSYMKTSDGFVTSQDVEDRYWKVEFYFKTEEGRQRFLDTLPESIKNKQQSV